MNKNIMSLTTSASHASIPKLSVSIDKGRLSSATWLYSSNSNARPDMMNIDTIVIHNISLPPDKFGACNTEGLHYVKALFTNQLDWQAHPYFQTIEGAEVSAHLFIERDGAITQFVNFADRAWHAGRSSYLGRKECNDYSIGIELEGSDFTSFTAVQYEILAEVIAALNKTYPKTRRHLTGHSDIAPCRKTDPGDHFEWEQLRKRVSQYTNT